MQEPPEALAPRLLYSGGRESPPREHNNVARDEAPIPAFFETKTLDSADQVQAWQERFRPVFDVAIDRPPESGFLGEHRMWKFGEFTLSELTGPDARVTRTARNLRQDPIDHWVLTLNKRGTTSIATEKGGFRADPGVPFLWSLGQKCEMQRTAVERIQVFLPRDAFREVATQFDQLSGGMLAHSLRDLLGDYMLALLHRLPAVTADQLPHLAAATRGMVAACLAPSIERLCLAREQIDVGRMERVRLMVRRHLRSPKLNPETLSRIVGMSRSNLYRLLESSGGVARYIQYQRLLEARARLSDPESTQSITGIAEEFCFADPSSFSRAFRHEFGCSPSAVRASAIGGVPPSFVTGRPAGVVAGFGRLLR